MADKDLNKRVVENFIKAGALDSLGGNRKQFMMIYATILDSIAQEKKSTMAGQMTLFDFADESVKEEFEVKMPDVAEYAKETKLAFEKEVLGVYLSGHPLEEYEEKWRKIITRVTTDFLLDEETGQTKVTDGESAMVGGMIVDKTVKYTKNNKTMAFITLEDLVETLEIIIFPRDYEKNSQLLEMDNKVFVRGRVSTEEEKNGKLICERIYSFDETKKELWLQFDSMEAYTSQEQELLSMLAESDGEDGIVIYIASTKQMKRLPPSRSIQVCPEIVNNLTNFLGERY